MKTTKELDKDDIAAVVRMHLEREGYEVQGVSVEVVKGADGLRRYGFSLTWPTVARPAAVTPSAIARAAASSR